MGDIVNLNKYRKRKARTGDSKTAAQNRAKSGLSKSVRSLQKARREKDEKDLDGKKTD